MDGLEKFLFMQLVDKWFGMLSEDIDAGAYDTEDDTEDGTEEDMPGRYSQTTNFSFETCGLKQKFYEHVYTDTRLSYTVTRQHETPQRTSLLLPRSPNYPITSIQGTPEQREAAGIRVLGLLSRNEPGKRRNGMDRV